MNEPYQSQDADLAQKLADALLILKTLQAFAEPKSDPRADALYADWSGPRCGVESTEPKL